MKKLFYAGLALLILFELANVWFIMPMPYSQRVRSIDLAYTLYSWRWLIRGACAVVALVGLRDVWRATSLQRVLAGFALVVAGATAYATNFVMSADHMFQAPKSVDMRPSTHNSVALNRLVVGVEVNGDARAYPVQFIGYHHQVRDSIGGSPVLVTFCTVCRTGRAFSPVVKGQHEQFRLVGMDHFNAMFEDQATGSWWRQANGEAIAGPLKGVILAEVPSQQMTLAEWLALHPQSLIMQPDSTLTKHYSQSFDYETGASRGSLTGTDTASWHDKSWVVGISLDGAAKAYDWNRLKRERVINDEVGGVPVVLALAADNLSFVAFRRQDAASRLAIRGDSLVSGDRAYSLAGKGAADELHAVSASQEFWHSWRTFHPGTATY